MLKIKVFQDEKKLYMTDSIEEFHSLMAEGKCVIPIYTMENQNLDWPFCPYAITNPEEFDDSELLKIYQRVMKLPWTISETDRLLIRETTVRDVDDFYRIYSDSSITEYMENLFEDPDEERCYTSKYIDTIYSFYNYGLWSIILRETGEVIGRVGLTPKEPEYPELGFLVDVKYQNMGIAYEACECVIRYTKENLDMNILQARVDPRNTKSINLLSKLGFKKTDNRSTDGLIVYILNLY